MRTREAAPRRARPSQPLAGVAPEPRAPAPLRCSLRADRGPSYARRRPEETVLYEVVREELETFLARASARDRPVPRFVERELRAYL